MSGDFSAEFDGETARLCIQHVYPEDEGEYTCVAYNDLGKAFTSACLIVDGNFVFNRSNKAIWKHGRYKYRWKPSFQSLFDHRCEV